MGVGVPRVYLLALAGAAVYLAVMAMHLPTALRRHAELDREAERPDASWIALSGKLAGAGSPAARWRQRRNFDRRPGVPDDDGDGLDDDNSVSPLDSEGLEVRGAGRELPRSNPYSALAGRGSSAAAPVAAEEAGVEAEEEEEAEERGEEEEAEKGEAAEEVVEEEEAEERGTPAASTVQEGLAPEAAEAGPGPAAGRHAEKSFTDGEYTVQIFEWDDQLRADQAEIEAILQRTLGPDLQGATVLRTVKTANLWAEYPKPLLRSDKRDLEGCCKNLKKEGPNIPKLLAEAEGWEYPEWHRKGVELEIPDAHLVQLSDVFCKGFNCSDYQTKWDFQTRCESSTYKRRPSNRNFCKLGTEARGPPSGRVKRVKKLLPLYGIWSNSFQHFSRDYAPRLALLPDKLLHDPELNVLLDKSDNEIVNGILRRFGITRDRMLYFDTSTLFHAETLYLPLVDKYDVQIYLYDEYRTRIGVRHAPVQERPAVLYLSRAGLASRKVANEQEVLQALRGWLKARGRGERLVVASRPESLERMIKTLAGVKMIVGPHGGAMYNAMLAQKHTFILEFAPLLETYHTICRSASILEQYYWMVPWPQMAHRTPAGPLAVRALERVFDAAMKLHDSLDADSQHIGAGEASQAALRG